MPFCFRLRIVSPPVRPLLTWLISLTAELAIVLHLSLSGSGLLYSGSGANRTRVFRTRLPSFLQLRSGIAAWRWTRLVLLFRSRRAASVLLMSPPLGLRPRTRGTEPHYQTLLFLGVPTRLQRLG